MSEESCRFLVKKELLEDGEDPVAVEKLRGVMVCPYFLNKLFIEEIEEKLLTEDLEETGEP